jgi:hypothetical protein
MAPENQDVVLEFMVFLLDEQPDTEWLFATTGDCGTVR